MKEEPQHPKERSSPIGLKLKASTAPKVSAPAANGTRAKSGREVIGEMCGRQAKRTSAISRLSALAKTQSENAPFAPDDWVMGSISDFALRLRYTECMKSASIPSVRVDPAFRAEVESVLGQGETLSEFVEASIRAGVHHRRAQAEFIARGLRSGEEAKRTGIYVDADVVLDRLQHKLDVARGQTQPSSAAGKR